MNEAVKIIRCQNCGTKNRVSLSPELTAVCGKCKSPLKVSVAPETVTDANFQEVVGKSALLVLVDFWAVWCPPCRMIAPIVDELAAELAGQVRVGKLDVDGNQITASRFQVQSIPTLIVFKNGQEVDRLVGAQSKTAIMNRLQQFIGK